MNGVHDMGGMHGFGPVEPEANEPVFHHRWEARTHAIAKALGSWGKWNIDYGRHQRELIPPAEYLRMRFSCPAGRGSTRHENCDLMER